MNKSLVATVGVLLGVFVFGMIWSVGHSLNNPKCSEACRVIIVSTAGIFWPYYASYVLQEKPHDR